MSTCVTAEMSLFLFTHIFYSQFLFCRVAIDDDDDEDDVGYVTCFFSAVQFVIYHICRRKFTHFF